VAPNRSLKVITNYYDIMNDWGAAGGEDVG
jgi:hypothetical protein